MGALADAIIMVIRAVHEVDPDPVLSISASPGNVVRVRVGDVDTAAQVAAKLGGRLVRIDQALPRQHPLPAMTVHYQLAGESWGRSMRLPATQTGSPLEPRLKARVADALGCRPSEVTIIRAMADDQHADLHIYPVVLLPPGARDPVTVEITAAEPNLSRLRPVPMRT